AAPAEPAGSGAPDHVIEQAFEVAHPAAAAAPADTGDGPHLKITLSGVDAKDRELLTEELGNLGKIVGRQEVAADLTLWLESD
ncbi:chemotaxis protein CheA, partial [Burkholderia stagnalis]